MARLPSYLYLIQQHGGVVVLFEEGSEREVASFLAADGNAMAKAQKTIFDDPEMSDEDKCFAALWSGYFYAYACMGTPAEGIEELTIEYLRDKILAELGDENDLAAEREVPDYDPEPEVDDEGGMSEVYGSPTGRLPAPYGSIQEPQEQSFRPLDPEIFPDGGYTA